MEQKLAQSEALLNHLRLFLSPKSPPPTSILTAATIMPQTQNSQSTPLGRSPREAQSPPPVTPRTLSPPRMFADTRNSPLRQQYGNLTSSRKQSPVRNSNENRSSSPQIFYTPRSQPHTPGKFTPRNQPPSQRSTPTVRGVSTLSVVRPLDRSLVSPSTSILDSSTQRGDVSKSSAEEFQEYSASDIFEFASDVNVRVIGWRAKGQP